MPVDFVTKRWIYNASDEYAAEHGCVFDNRRAEHILDFFENHLVLFQGTREPFRPIPAAKEMLQRVFGWVMRNDKGEWVRRFTKAFWWVPKKNGKSPVSAGIMLYLLLADGEYGQNVYCAAKDGKQADIVYQHSFKMAIKSPALRPMLKFNRTEKTIEFPEMDSFLKRISGDNPDSQEGLNGSCVIDEMHVMTHVLYPILEGMGASRKEPLMFHVSTAGSDLEGVGKLWYDEGKRVEAGQSKDLRLFHQSYELPEGISDKDLKIPDDASPEEIERRLQPWIKANPGYGITLQKDWLLNKIRASQGSTLRFAKTKMYHGNQWQVGENPAIDPDAWSKCLRDWKWTSLLADHATAG